MKSKSSKPIENIKKICSDLGHLFEEMEKQEAEVAIKMRQKMDADTKQKDEVYKELKQMIADLS